MLRYIFLTAVFSLFWTPLLWAQNFNLISVDTSKWPEVDVVAALPEGNVNAADYSLRLAPSGRSVVATGISGPMPTDPANMVVAVDTSRSLTPAHLNAAKKALEDYVDYLDPEERLALLAFNDDVQLERGFTADRLEFKNSLAQLQPAGNKTQLYRTLLYSIDLLKNLPGRHHLLVVTDGHDEGSDVTREQVLQSAREHNVKISTVGIPGLPEETSKQYLENLKELATKTGGLNVDARTAAELQSGVYGLLDQQRSLSQGDRKRLYKIRFDLDGTVPKSAVSADLIRTDGRDIRFVNLYLQPPQTSRALAANGNLADSYGNSMRMTDSEGLAIGGALAGGVGAIERGVGNVVSSETVAQQADESARSGESTARMSMADTGYQAVSAAPPAGSRDTGLWYNPLFWLILLFLLALGYWLWRRYHQEMRVRSDRVATSWVLDIPETGQKLSLPVGKWKLGAARENYVVVNADTISPTHAEIIVTDDGWVIRDLGSATGIRVNGVEVVGPGMTIKPGDELLIGQVRAVLL
ncbi:hypothetical protein C4J81_03330 [Deltaproteobacteria bacterium Smac51]|nr:hypothetical protein C4J81_03330 [Deltaproteobacteria bacterium Smac51]